MGIKGIFKKWKKGGRIGPDGEVKKEEATKEIKSVELKGDVFSYGQIVSPYLTEKTSLLNASHQYVFKVFKGANKIEVKKAVEKLYEVRVEKVGMMVVPGKERRLGRFKGERAGFKKAIVRLRRGEKIEVAH